MTPEELLKPRYKVIAMFPGSDLILNEILFQDEILIDMKSYPHLFKRLGWWEERKPEDMPKYVKDEKGNFYSTAEWRINGRSVEVMDDDFNIGYVPVWEYIPATEEEYLNQQK